MDVEPTEPITIVLGAGASRSVSYAHLGEAPSHLDSDFFDLLQRIPHKPKDDDAIIRVLKMAKELPAIFWRSMEKSFYTLHLRAYLKDILFAENQSIEKQIISDFAQAIEALLRKAHGISVCAHHAQLFEQLGITDAIVSFNYDLVVERAIGKQAMAKGIGFGDWVYGLSGRPAPYSCPVILKMHGSSNWQLTKVKNGWVPIFFHDHWSDFYVSNRPGYRAHSGEEPGIILPFWDKKIEGNPWLHLWKQAYEHLKKTKTLIVWGYSLPPTDIKTRELFTLGLQRGDETLRLCVIDPSPESRQRWRDLLPNARYWEYHDIQSFFSYAPPWWAIPIHQRKKGN
jgi:hypothetical protein